MRTLAPPLAPAKFSSLSFNEVSLRLAYAPVIVSGATIAPFYPEIPFFIEFVPKYIACMDNFHR